MSNPLPVPFDEMLPAGPLSAARVVAVAAPETWAHPRVIESLAAHTARGETVGVLIGHNRLDLHALTRLAHAHGLAPAPLLRRIYVSRAFTCHQMHRRIITLGGQENKETRNPVEQRWSALYVLGLLDTFYDEDVQYAEAARLLRECLDRLHALAAGGLPVFITLEAPREPGRERMVALALAAADVQVTGAPALPEGRPKRKGEPNKKPILVRGKITR